MGVNPLVSFVSPCYNGEKFVGRMLDSILAQTYSNIEIICVNDGSTDDTERVIKSYSDKFSKRGMTLKYYSQENQGQASAVNNGLKHVTGDYLCWIDCDDFLTYNSVEIKLNVLENKPEFGICTSDIFIVDEADINNVQRLNSDHFGNLSFQQNQFMLTIVGMSAIENLGHMVRMSCFDKINPKREINCCPEGQNYQILLPIYYYFPRVYVDIPLGCYVQRKCSHYHSERTREREMLRQNRLLNMLEEVLNTLGLPPMELSKLSRISYFANELRKVVIC